LAQKITETANHQKSVNYSTVNVSILWSYVDINSERVVDRSESRGYWTCCWRVASTSTRLRSCRRM